MHCIIRGKFVISPCRKSALLAPKASEASKGAFYLCPGGVIGYCDAWTTGYCVQCMCYIFSRCCKLLWSYNHCHVHHWVCYKGVCRKVTNPYAVVPLLEAGGYCGFWWYFIRKVWSVDHIIIVMFIIECAIRGSAEKSRIYTQWWHFLRLVVTVDFDDISLEKYGQLII